MTTLTKSLFLAAVLCLLTSSLASAQTLAGTVRDTSGAVLPGVTVEAASPALIEKTRTAVTDGSGQYQITNLPPGTYTITFSLQGFGTARARRRRAHRRRRHEPSTPTCASARWTRASRSPGETPVVDVQSARQQTVLSGEVVRALPASRGYGNYLAAIPAIQATGFNSGLATNTNFFTARGGRANEGVVQIDGLNVGSPFNGGGVSNYAYDMNNAIEVQVSISGGLGEADRGAPSFNIIPEDGRQQFQRQVLRELGRQVRPGVEHRRRAAGARFRRRAGDPEELGQPTSRWAARSSATASGSSPTRARRATTPRRRTSTRTRTSATPARGPGRRTTACACGTIRAGWVNSVRLTSQVSQKNKVGFYFDYTMNCSGSSFKKDSGECRRPGDDWTASGPGIGPGVATTSPEAGTIWNAPLSILQGTWTSPLSNRLLFESGYSEFRVRWGDVMPEGAITDLIPVTEQSTNAGVPFANYHYRGWLAQPSQNQKHATWRASASYVSGSNNLKFGHQGGFMVAKTTTQVAQQLSYTFNNGSPIQLSTRVGPTRVSDRLRYGAFYVQDAWTRGRLTLQGALRFELASSWSPAARTACSRRTSSATRTSFRAPTA